MTEQELARRRADLMRKLRKEGYSLGNAGLVHTGESSEHDCVILPTATVLQMLSAIDQLDDMLEKLAVSIETLAGKMQG